MMPSLASRHVLSVSACCASCRGESGTRSWNGLWLAAREGGCVGAVWLSREADARNTATTAAASDALMPRILHRPSSVGGALVRTREPLAQLPRRVDRRRAVERHQRRRSTGQPDDVRAPAILLHRGDLDQIWTSPDGLLKAMDSGVHSVGEKIGLVERCALYGLLRSKQAKRRTKTRPQSSLGSFLDGSRREKNLGSQSLHRKSTDHPQVLHRWMS